MAEPDILHDALRDALLATLLGSTSVPHTSADSNGNVLYGTITIPSALGERIKAQAYKGDYDDLIRRAMDLVDPAAIAREVEGLLAEQIISGLGHTSSWGGRSEPNWLQQQAKSIAVEACTTALAADESLLDTLRARIGAEVDRNRVGITVSLSDPEAK